MKSVVSLRYKVFFKKVFAQPEIFTAFVKDIAGVDVNIDTVQVDKKFSTPLSPLKQRFTLYAEDKKNQIAVNIEHARFPENYDDFLHYHCVMMLEQASEVERPIEPLQTLTIVMFSYGDKHKSDYAEINLDMKDAKGTPLHEIQHRVLYLSPKYVDDKTPEPSRMWLRAIADSFDEEVDDTQYQHAAIQEIFALIDKDTVSPSEYAVMQEEDIAEHLARMHYQAGFEHGYKEAQYLRRKLQNTAQLLHDQGLDLGKIAEVTGLSAQQLQDLN